MPLFHSTDDRSKVGKRKQEQDSKGLADDEEDMDENDDRGERGVRDRTRSQQGQNTMPRVSALLLAGEWVVRQVSCGYRHTAFVTTTGLLLTCGHGETGRLGHGDERTRQFPTVIAQESCLQVLLQALARVDVCV